MRILGIAPSQQPSNQYVGGCDGYSDSEQFWMEDLAHRLDRRVKAQNWPDFQSIVLEEGSVGGQVRKSNALGVTEHLALHTNATSHGSLVIRYPGSESSQRFAEAIYPHIAAASDRPDNGIWANAKYYETRETHATAIIVECADHSTAAEAEEIRNSLDEYVEAILRGLADYYDLPYTAPSGAPIPLPPRPVIPAPTPAAPVRNYLQKGDTGAYVTALQNRLNVHGANIGVDGIFGNETLGAVTDFQTQHGLVDDGLVGPLTWGELNKPPVRQTPPTIAYGAGSRRYPNATVARLQRELNGRGANIAVDGIFRSATKAAVIAFQKRAGIGVDGVCGPQTWGALGY